MSVVVGVVVVDSCNELRPDRLYPRVNWRGNGNGIELCLTWLRSIALPEFLLLCRSESDDSDRASLSV